MVIKRLRAAGAGDEMLQRLLRGGAMALIIKIASAGLSFLMFLALARATDVESYAHFGFAYSLAATLAVVGSFGQRMTVLRFAPAYALDHDQLRLVGVVRYGYVLVAAGCTGLGLGLAALALLWPDLEARGHLVAAAALTVAVGLAEYQARVLRSVAGVALSLAPRDVIWRFAVALVAGVWLAVDAPKMSAEEAIWITAGLLGGAVIGQALMHPLTRPRSLLLAPAQRDGAVWRRNWPGSWGTSVIQSVGSSFSVVVVGLLLTPAETAEYFAAFRLALVLSLVPLAANMVCATMISQRWHRGDTVGVQRVCRLVAVGSAAPALVGFLAFVLFGDQLMALFGPDYAAAHWPLVTLAASQMALALFGPANSLMHLGGRQMALMRIVAVTNLTSIAAVVALSLAFGVMGAAVATTAGQIAWVVWAHMDVRRHLHVDSSILSVLRRRRKVKDADAVAQ